MPSSGPAERAALSFVIPWAGEEIRGGAELQGWETVRELHRRGWDVEVLTTTSRGFLHRWDANHHPEGLHTREGVAVRRFAVDPRDEAAFNAANGAIMAGARPTVSQEEAFVRQNINSTALEEYLASTPDRLFIFLPYLYGTTLRGALVRPERSLLMPCFHDEPYARLAAVRRTLRETRGCLYLTPEEEATVARIAGPGVPGRVVGGGIDTGAQGSAERFCRETGIASPFVLYVGRVDAGKNAHLLAAYFSEWRRSRGSDVRLVLMGAGNHPLPDDPAVVHLGPRDDRTRADACTAALLLCQPSVNESFSRVIMEAWLCGAPVTVSGWCDVTREHCRRSGGGLWFDDYWEFARVMDLLAADPSLRSRLGEAGRRYVLANYTWDTVCDRLVGAVAELTGIEPARREGGA